MKKKSQWENRVGDISPDFLKKKAEIIAQKTPKDVKNNFSVINPGMSGTELQIRKKLDPQEQLQFEKISKKYHQKILRNIQAEIDPFTDVPNKEDLN